MTAARFAWHADSYDTSLASIRYRLLIPLTALRRDGVSIERFDPARDPADYDGILFCKSQGAGAVAIARAARAAGRAVIYDLCDNVFAAHDANRLSAARLERTRELLSLATHATFSTATLAAQIGERHPALTPQRMVIADALDFPEDGSPPPPSLADRWHRWRLGRFHARHRDALHCIWFGKSLGNVSGYVHIDAAVRELRRFAPVAPATLTIVSNDRLSYMRARARWDVPTLYLPWSLATFADILAQHRVSLIPIETNDYTSGKTMNRPATSLIHGLGVVADPLPSYTELAPYIALDDWQGGLRRYREMAPDTVATIAARRTYLADRYSGDAIARQWRALLDTI